MRELQRSVWLAAGALALGAGTVLALGAGTAHADANTGASASDGARSAGAAARSSARESGQRRSAASVSAAAPDRNADAARSTVTATQRSSGVGAAPTPAPCLQSGTCGTATFGFTGAPQTWTIPAGVQSAFITVQGGFGGPCGITSCITGYTPTLLYPAIVDATLALPPDSASLNVLVGASGGGTDGRDGGAGGYNGGASGGSGSLFGQGGAGGGGATSVSVDTGSPDPAVVLVAGGGGGYGGIREGAPGVGGAAGGVGDGGGASTPGPGGVWRGADGTGASGDNGGAGGAGGTQSGGNGSSGGDAETGSGNGGGGGGGGGYFGGAGGQPGQASIDPFATAGAGGGGGGGSSYADPVLTTNAFAVMASAPYDPTTGNISPELLNGSALIQWVDILTTALRPLRVGRPTNQQPLAAIGAVPISSLVWQTGSGVPAGLTMSSSGVLSGTPTKAGSYSFLVTVTAFYGFPAPMASSVITYSGTVCSVRCGRGGRTR